MGSVEDLRGGGIADRHLGAAQDGALDGGVCTLAICETPAGAGGAVSIGKRQQGRPYTGGGRAVSAIPTYDAFAVRVLLMRII